MNCTMRSSIIGIISIIHSFIHSDIPSLSLSEKDNLIISSFVAGEIIK